MGNTKMTEEVKKTSNPVFTEGKDTNGVPPTPIRTDSMFDSKEKQDLTAKKPSNNNLTHGQKTTGHDGINSNRITMPGTNQREGTPNMYIYFDQPGDYQR